MQSAHKARKGRNKMWLRAPAVRRLSQPSESPPPSQSQRREESYTQNVESDVEKGYTYEVCLCLITFPLWLWLVTVSPITSPQSVMTFNALPADCMPDCSFKWIARDANQVSSLVGQTANLEEIKPARWSSLLSSAHVFLFPHFIIFPFPYFPFLLLGQPPENAISGIPLSLSG